MFNLLNITYLQRLSTSNAVIKVENKYILNVLDKNYVESLTYCDGVLEFADVCCALD